MRAPAQVVTAVERLVGGDDHLVRAVRRQLHDEIIFAVARRARQRHHGVQGRAQLRRYAPRLAERLE
jgi:hypothetical protein